MTIWKVTLSPDVRHFIDKQDYHIAERLRKGLRKLEV